MLEFTCGGSSTSPTSNDAMTPQEFMQLPMDERRAILKEQAEEILPHYQAMQNSASPPSGATPDYRAAHEVSAVHVTTVNDPTTGHKMLCVNLEIGGEWRRVFSQWTRTVHDGIVNEFIEALGIERAPVVDITAFDAEPVAPTDRE